MLIYGHKKYSLGVFEMDIKIDKQSTTLKTSPECFEQLLLDIYGGWMCHWSIRLVLD